MKIRINKFVAQATGLSRRSSDKLIEQNKIFINGRSAQPGDQVDNKDKVEHDGKTLSLTEQTTLIMLNKPAGYVSSRAGQGSHTIYNLLPKELHKLKTVGRLDKASTGLILLTDDGQLANRLTHPSYSKTKLYNVILDKDIAQKDFQIITGNGVKLFDGLSKLGLKELTNKKSWQVSMSEGRNRQIRRTFSGLGYTVIGLHRVQFGEYSLHNLSTGKYKEIAPL
jgi:23S rRNA pseudouridine2605 synthase